MPQAQDSIKEFGDLTALLASGKAPPSNKRRLRDLSLINKRQMRDLSPDNKRQLRDLSPDVERQTGDLSPIQSGDNQETLKDNDKRQSRDNVLAGVDEKTAYDALDNLVGLQALLADVVIQDCLENGSNTTQKMKNIFFQELLLHKGCSVDSIRKMFDRLVNKKGLFINRGKAGANGFRRFDVPQSVLMAYSKLYPNWRQSRDIKKANERQTRDPSLNQSGDNQETIKPLINSSSNITTIIECEALEKIGFTQKCAQQILNKKKIAPEALQHSIDIFAFEIEFNNIKPKEGSTLLKMFMGIMIGFGFYNAPENYQTLDGRSQVAFLKQKQKELQRAQELNQQIKETSDKIELETWLSTKTTKEIDSILSAAPFDKKWPKVVVEKEKRKVLMKVFKEVGNNDRH